VLVGRTDEVSRIERLLECARDGESCALVVHGDAGIGKTALLDEVVARTAGFTVLRARPLQAECELPFAGLFDLVRPLLPLLGRIPPQQAAVLSGALALGPPTPGDRFAAAAATISLLSAGAEQGPILVVVDDAQWLDSPSREALEFASRRLGSVRILVLMAMRDRPMRGDSGIERMQLRGLVPAAAAELLAAAGRPVSPTVRDRLIAETAANPLALREALSTLTNQQLRGVVPLTEPIPIAATLERSFSHRLESMPEETRRALAIAAASDTNDGGQIARAMASVGLESASLDAAVRNGLVAMTAGRVDFVHPLIRSAAYRGQAPIDMRSAHRALAQTMEPDQLDRIAWHLACASDSPNEAVAVLLEQSATRANQRHGYIAAANCLAESARLSPVVAVRVSRTLGAAHALSLGGQQQVAVGLLLEVLHLATDPIQRADLQQLRASALLNISPTTDVFALLVDEADLVQSHDPSRAGTMLAMAALSAMAAAKVELAQDTARRAVQLAPTGSPAWLFATLALSFPTALAGQVAEARSTLISLIPLLEKLDPLSEKALMLVAVAQIFNWTEEWPTAARMLDYLLQAARAASALTLLPYPLAVLAELKLRTGRVALAYAAATESVQIAIETSQDFYSPFCFVTLARVEAILGLDGSCRAHVAAGLAIARRLGVVSIENYAGAVLGLLELSVGRPDRAIPHLEGCARLEQLCGVGLPTAVQWNADLVEAYASVGRTQDARRELDTLQRQGRETGSRWASATAARCSGLLADDEQYEALLLNAIDLHAEEEPFELARTELCLGRRRSQSGLMPGARVVLRQSLSRFEALGAEPWAQQAKAELSAIGDTPIPRQHARLTALTPQELQVALVVASGATNTEAAGTLFISSKTVEFHLSHVYRKLGVRSRTQLAVKVANLS
jgi:DNA-binding CsgD family transcriptional regulator